MWVSTEIYKHTNFYSEGKKMKKKIIAALAASALFATVAGVSALAEGIEEDGEVLVEVLRRGGEEASAGRVRPGGEEAAEESPAGQCRAHFFSSSTAW
jgi:hypothetical protein